MAGVGGDDEKEQWQANLDLFALINCFEGMML